MASIKVYMKEQKELKIKGTPKVESKLSKKLIHPTTGETVYYIDKNEGMRLGLMSKMNFTNLHPLAQNMCEITIEIERV
jgi:hypothetical protein